ncbi:MAG: hypothetical protein ABFD62_07175 [Syntrophaceae bacterium]
MKKVVLFLVIIAVVCVSAPAFGGGSMGGEDLAVVADILLVRPIGVAAVVVGSAVFIVALPFSIPSGSVGLTAHVLIVEPFNYTFQRPIGYPDYRWDPAASKEP